MHIQEKKRKVCSQAVMRDMYGWFMVLNATFNNISEHVITQDKNHIPRNKNHIPPLRKPRGFSHQSYRSLTGKRQRHSERIIRRQPLQCGF
jgi:hypothetical protein